jgi:HAD superfamily hydrolase (TIGR01509 family)
MPAVRRAVFIDALGTMLWLEAPWERIDPSAVLGIEPDRVRAAFIAEMAYYMAHTEQGRDPDSLAELRRRCAAVLSRELGREIGVATMMDALHFHPYDDAIPALQSLRGAGIRLVCVSNWDCSLPGVLARLGLGVELDGVVSSATAGSRKPDPAIFAPALAIAGCPASEALHVGDSADDVTAARDAGIDVLKLDRGGAGDISSLTEISDHLGR